MGPRDEVDFFSPQRACTIERGLTPVMYLLRVPLWQLGRGTKKAQTLVGSA